MGPALNKAESAVVAAALASKTQAEGAAAARMSLRTYQRYLGRDNVREAITDGAMQRLRGVTTALARHVVRAADVLGEMAAGDVPPTSARVAACRAVIELGLHAVEVERLVLDLEALERAPAWPLDRGGSS
jgi:hypothetical protein